MKFLADRMLGRLSSWLRILGYDTVSANSFFGLSNAAEDTYMLEISGLERRTLLTKAIEGQGRFKTSVLFSIRQPRKGNALFTIVQDNSLLLVRCRQQMV